MFDQNIKKQTIKNYHGLDSSVGSEVCLLVGLIPLPSSIKSGWMHMHWQVGRIGCSVSSWLWFHRVMLSFVKIKFNI